MSSEECTKEKLWSLLVETVHASVMYPTHKAYTRETILQEKPDITATELANRMNMPLGEAIVILRELEEERKSSA
ncbi:winged helix-turn-helix domain-containing protein [Candidatus Bathyarchaeota archaeon]|nr:winged helix-turn-helix domain-containing protein [Candidatus Bathyarchaeota archaeon]